MLHLFLWLYTASLLSLAVYVRPVSSSVSKWSQREASATGESKKGTMRSHDPPGEIPVLLSFYCYLRRSFRRCIGSQPTVAV